MFKPLLSFGLSSLVFAAAVVLSMFVFRRAGLAKFFVATGRVKFALNFLVGTSSFLFIVCQAISFFVDAFRGGVFDGLSFGLWWSLFILGALLAASAFDLRRFLQGPPTEEEKPGSVSALPVLDPAQYPALPDLPVEATMLLPIQTALNHLGSEAALGIIATYAIRNGNRWQPVSIIAFFEIADSSAWGLSPVVRTIIWELADQGMVKIVKHGLYDHAYIVPLPKFAAALNTGSFRRISCWTT
jgi:hypothetical protein